MSNCPERIFSIFSPSKLVNSVRDQKVESRDHFKQKSNHVRFAQHAMVLRGQKIFIDNKDSCRHCCYEGMTCISSEEFTKAGRVKNVEKYLLNICLRIHKLTLVFLLDDGQHFSNMYCKRVSIKVAAAGKYIQGKIYFVRTNVFKNIYIFFHKKILF